MKIRQIGWIGGGLLLTALMVGAQALPAGGSGVRAAQTAAATPTPGAGMMGRGMMSGGMMNGMMGGGMMGGGMMDADDMSQMMGTTNAMMGDLAQGDPATPFDLRFLDAMIPHHQMAVQAAQHMIADSARPELRDLAQRIISGQQSEIAQMTTWRTTWYTDTARSGSAGCAAGMTGTEQGMGTTNMMGTANGGMGAMMGRTNGVDLDRMFLQMMIPHHEAAIRMAQQALQQASHPEIKTLAQQIITTQQAEITEMRTYLRQWYGVEIP